MFCFVLKRLLSLEISVYKVLNLELVFGISLSIMAQNSELDDVFRTVEDKQAESWNKFTNQQNNQSFSLFIFTCSAGLYVIFEDRKDISIANRKQ